MPVKPGRSIPVIIVIYRKVGGVEDVWRVAAAKLRDVVVHHAVLQEVWVAVAWQGAQPPADRLPGLLLLPKELRHLGLQPTANLMKYTTSQAGWVPGPCRSDLRFGIEEKHLLLPDIT